MIFREPLLAKVLDGTKTVTRRPHPWPHPCRYKVGMTYAVQPGRGKKAVARIRVLDVRRERSFGAVRAEWGGLRREGFQSYSQFVSYLRRLYGETPAGEEIPVGPVDRIEFELVS